jgi:hypothetical protein
VTYDSNSRINSPVQLPFGSDVFVDVVIDGPRRYQLELLLVDTIMTPTSDLFGFADQSLMVALEPALLAL